MQYLLQLNLQQRAALSAAISFWEKKEIKDRVIECLSSYDKSEICDAKKEWRRFIKTVIEEWSKDILPPLLKTELIHVVKEMGEKIFNWYQYINNENAFQYRTEKNVNYEMNKKSRLLKTLKTLFVRKVNFLYEKEKISNENWNIDFIDEIYWTPFGTVDEVKIFKSLWLTNSNYNIINVYNLACRYALEEYINDLSKKIPSKKLFNDRYDNDDLINQYIMIYWHHGIDNFISTEKMVRLSVREGHSIAMKYLWQKLTKEKRNRNLLEWARLAVIRYNYYAEQEQQCKEHQKQYKKFQDCKCLCNKKYLRVGSHKKEKYVEICIFLINQMTENNKRAFFNVEIDPYFRDSEKIDVKDEILKMLLSAWPWQELFIIVLEDILKYQDHNSTMCCTFLNTIANKMVEDYELGYSVEMSKYQSLLREAWLIIPEAIKRKTMLKCSKKNLICNLIDIWDLDSLKLILDDPGVADVRDQLADFAFHSYKQLILEDQFERLDQLMEKIFRSEEEKNNFKQNIFFRNEFMYKDEDALNKILLNWESLTSEEMDSLFSSFINNFMYYMQNLSLCQQLIKLGKFDVVDKFINWTFETDEEREQCINYFKSDAFLFRQVHEIWDSYGIKKAKLKSFQFLHWLFKSPEEIERFKQEKLVNIKDEFAFNFLVYQNIYRRLSDFLSWCLLSNEEIKQITQLVCQSSLYKMIMECKSRLGKCNLNRYNRLDMTTIHVFVSYSKIFFFTPADQTNFHFAQFSIKHNCIQEQNDVEDEKLPD